MPSVLPHWPLETALVRSYSDNWNKSVSVDDDASKERPNLTPSDARPRMEQITFTSGEWTGLQQANAELLRDAWLDAFGLNEVKRRWAYQAKDGSEHAEVEIRVSKCF